MSFTEPVFLLFLPSVVALYWLLPRRFRRPMLLAASLLFYAWHDVRLLALIACTIAVSFLCAIAVEDAETQKGKRCAVGFAAAVCLGLLFVFKYLDFAVGSIVSVGRLLGAEVSFDGADLLLPMGISFYVFQTMSYVFDVSRGSIRAERNMIRYALFVTFFPQLVAGPIERPADLMPQLEQPEPLTRRAVSDAARLLLRGYAKKLLIADHLAIAVDRVYADPAAFDGSALALATILFSVQIYCDFSGYSDIARGCARLMGIRLQENFRRPYAATSVRDFWRRWHISLSSWLSDYLYIPLGGSRVGTARTCLNILITFLVSGLWHGASWTYVLWGGLHGIYLIVERLLCKEKAPGRAVTFALVCFAWIFFRSTSVSDAFLVIGRIFSAWSFEAALSGTELLTAALLIAVLPLLERLPRLQSVPTAARNGTVLAYFFVFLAMIACRFLVLSQHGDTAFLYFQF